MAPPGLVLAGPPFCRPRAILWAWVGPLGLGLAGPPGVRPGAILWAWAALLESAGAPRGRGLGLGHAGSGYPNVQREIS